MLKTHGPSWCFKGKGKILGTALAWGEHLEQEDHRAYFDTGHQGFAPFSPEHTFDWLRDQAKRPELTWYMHHAQYDKGWLTRHNVRFAGKVICTATAMPLIDENRRSYALDDIAQDLLGERKDHSMFREMGRSLGLPKSASMTTIKSRLMELPAHMVGPYAEQDAALPRKLWAKMKPMIDRENLWEIFELESELIDVLIAMRAQGVRVDMEVAYQTSQTFGAQIKQMQYEMHQMAHRDVQVWASESLVQAFESQGLPLPAARSATGEVSFRGEWLEKHEHPFCRLVAKTRKMDKAKNTFIDGYILAHAVNGRIHATFSPLRRSTDEGEHAGGAVTGRFSSSDPNLQNLPSDRSDAELAELVRGFFLPNEGDPLWGSVDWSSQEPRLMVHFCHIAGYKTRQAVKPMFDAYWANPRMKFHQMGADITGLRLRVAKDVTLGKMYGMGGAKLCKTYLHLPTKWLERNGKKFEVAGEEGQKVMDQYDAKLPFVRGIAELCTKKAETRGWIRTILGRVRHFQSASHPDGAFPYKALNCLIQGSAADMMKKAMVLMFRQGIVPLATVHDELGLSLQNAEQAQERKQIMIDAVPLTIPVEADVELGVSWGASGKKAA